jgi:DNA-binding IclR family transcriptional regulator
MSVKTAERTLDLLETFASEGRPLSLSELGRLLSIPVSSCLGLLRTLQATGYLYEVHRRGYYPTKRLLGVALKIAANDPLLDRLAPFLDELRVDSGETAVVAKLSATNVVYLDVHESQQTIRYSAQSGDFRDPHANSLGKALLSTYTPVERRALLAGYSWTAHTEHTITSLEAFEADLARGARRGWYLNLGESLPDIAGVACPVALDGERYAISIAGPVYRMKPDLAAHGRRLLAAVERIAGTRIGMQRQAG